MKKLLPYKGLLSWILVGSLLGLGVAGLRILFNWDREFTNVVLFSLVGVVVLAFVAKFVWDYIVMRQQLKSYQRYLDTYDMTAYLQNAERAVEKTTSKAYQNIHRMNLSLGYAYVGEYPKAIEVLSKVNIGDKLNSSSNLINILNLINYTIQSGDVSGAKRLIHKTSDLLNPVIDHPKYGFLIQLNRLQLALREQRPAEAQQALEKAELFLGLLNIDSLELTLAKAQTLTLTGQKDEARRMIEPLIDRPMAPVFKRQLTSLASQLNRE